jgi:hypothetical protein
MSALVVDRVARFLETRLSRRGFVVRSTLAATAVAVGPLDFLLRPHSAYQYICACGAQNCDCASTCCSGYSQFCCTINGGNNWCPSGSVIAGWWKADSSSFCSGPRYYLDCNATCRCGDGCGGGSAFCSPGCDGNNCDCALGRCENWASACFQFRYGQCNQQIACVGRIVCRIVSCVPPWLIEPSCTTAAATNEATAEMSVPCNTSRPLPPPSAPPCHSTATRCAVVGAMRSPSGAGYLMVTSYGRAFAFGDAVQTGSATGLRLGAPIVGIAANGSGRGYWLVAADGGVFAFGAAQFHGSLSGEGLAAAVTGIAALPTGGGYWLVAADGGVFAFGRARFHGSLGNYHLGRPVIAITATPSGNGYWLTTADGGVFGFGDARARGSLAGEPLAAGLVSTATTPTGKGYWLAAADGGVFCFGDARFRGSLVGRGLAQPVVSIVSTPTGRGYWLVAADGGVFCFGDARFRGSAA